MNTKLWQVNRLKTWLKSTGNYVLFVFFIITIVVLTVIIIDKHIYSKQPAQIQQPQIVFDHESALKRVDNLEKLIEKQAYQIQRLETDNETLTSANRQLEKRLQFHTDTLKRICEYIVVITVDKKILPRQCLSDYNWRREEGL